MNDFQKRILAYLQINEDDIEKYFKDVSKEDLESPYVFSNMDLACKRIEKAINNNEKIMIYGDYDCDGISATAILVKMFEYLNIKVGYYIPSRYIDGYGINLNRAEQIKSKGYSLVITVDNGVSAKEAIEYLTNNNIDVILTDHHEITMDLPRSYAVLHPDLKNEEKSIKQCGAYVAFMLSIAVLKRVDDYLLTLATQATISDMMPLIDENRTLVKLGIKILNQHPEYPVHLLIKENQIIDEEVLGFSICPKINAFGRIKEDTSVNDMVIFLVSEDRLLLKKLKNEIEIVNSYRRTILTESIQEMDYSKYDNQKIIVERLDEVSEGVIGLIAAKILSETNKPTIVFTKVKNQDVLKGSARSVKGFNLAEAFSSLSDLLLVYGGHEEAGGLSLNVENYDQFVERINLLAKDKELIDSQSDYIEIHNEDVTYENFIFIKKLSPFGVNFQIPKFLLNIEQKRISKMGKEMNHIHGFLGENASFVGFFLADSTENKESISALGNIVFDDFRKGKNIVFRIEKLI